MSFYPTFDLFQGDVSPQERLKGLMLKLILRKNNITPNKADGFLTTGTHADSDAEGDGQSVPATSAQSGTQN